MSSKPAAGASSTLKTVGLTMGKGDSWACAVDLADLQFGQVFIIDGAAGLDIPALFLDDPLT